MSNGVYVIAKIYSHWAELSATVSNFSGYLKNLLNSYVDTTHNS